MRALADDGWSPSAAQLVQQATSALSTAEANRPSGRCAFPARPSAPTTASPDATDSSSTTTTASPTPPATAPVSPATVSDPSGSTSPDGLAPPETPVPGAVSVISPSSLPRRTLADRGPGNGRRFPRDDRLLVRAGKQPPPPATPAGPPTETTPAQPETPLAAPVTQPSPTLPSGQSPTVTTVPQLPPAPTSTGPARAPPARSIRRGILVVLIRAPVFQRVLQRRHR